jgi:UDP-N-acetylglucosamine acyltransferase
MAVKIHPTAIIENGAEIGKDVSIGPFCTIGGNVKIGNGTTLQSHVVIDGHTTIGRDNNIFPFTVLGLAPQHAKYKGEKSTLVVGDRNLIREHVTMHAGTKIGRMTTIVGHDNMFFVATHVAHDCVVGNHVIMTNGSMIGGHVELDDYVYIGANSGIKQWVRVGKYAMVSGMTGVLADVIPFGTVFGSKGNLVSLNLTGLKRRGFDKDQITAIRRAYRMLFAEEGTFGERLAEVRRLYGDIDSVAQILQFIKDGGDKPLAHPARG